MCRKIKTFIRTNLYWHLVVLCLSFLHPLSSALGQSLERDISIEFDPVPDASKYEIKLTHTSDNKVTPKTFFTSNTTFSQKVPLGAWLFEVRSYDKRGVPGRWTPLGDVNIGFKAPTITAPIANTVIKTSEDKAIAVEFKWESFDLKASYKFKLIHVQSGKVVVDQTVIGNQFKHDLIRGTYEWSLESIVPPGATLDGQNPQTAPLFINAGQLQDPIITKFEKQPPEIISWKPVPNAQNYKITLKKLKSNSTMSDELMFDKKTSEIQENLGNNLKPGPYQFSLSAEADGYTPSRTRAIKFNVPEKASTNAPPGKPNPLTASPKVSPPEERHRPIDFLQGSIGPVFWSYNFSSSSGQKFNLVAGTITAISADIVKWFAKTETSAWGVEVRGRQTNIYLFETPDSSTPNQDKVSVSDRRMALIARKRKIINRVGLDVILGLGSHHYTYLIQDEKTSIVTPVSGDLVELYIGGASDWQFKTGNHLSFDLTFHPVGSAIGIAADKTLQYTATLKYLRRVFHDRSYLSFGLENFRSRINTHSEKFTGEAETISNWYRTSVGLSIKL